MPWFSNIFSLHPAMLCVYSCNLHVSVSLPHFFICQCGHSCLSVWKRCMSLPGSLLVCILALHVSIWVHIQYISTPCLSFGLYVRNLHMPLFVCKYVQSGLPDQEAFNNECIGEQQQTWTVNVRVKPFFCKFYNKIAFYFNFYCL